MKYFAFHETEEGKRGKEEKREGKIHRLYLFVDCRTNARKQLARAAHIYWENLSLGGGKGRGGKGNMFAGHARTDLANFTSSRTRNQFSRRYASKRFLFIDDHSYLSDRSRFGELVRTLVRATEEGKRAEKKRKE